MAGSKGISLRVCEEEGIDRTAWPLTRGVALPEGAVHDAQALRHRVRRRPSRAQLSYARYRTGATAALSGCSSTSKQTCLQARRAPSPSAGMAAPRQA